MQDEQEEYAPRENDHLVEPMFAGLGAGAESEPGPNEGTPPVEPQAGGEESPLRRFLRRLLWRH